MYDDMPASFFLDKAQESLDWAHSVVSKGQFVVLDTETTGLDSADEIVDIAVITSDASPLLNTLIKPTRRTISRLAAGIHGITLDMVASSPTFDDVYDQLLEAVRGKRVLIYNSQFDLRLIRQSFSTPTHYEHFLEAATGVDCAMTYFSQFYGDWSDWHGNFTWKSLSTACSYFGLPAPHHRALEDCIATLAVVKAMAAYASEMR